MERANQLVVAYLKHLRQNKATPNPEQLDVAISILQQELNITNASASPELLNFISSSDESVSSEQYKADGNKAMVEKNYQKAIECYTKAIENSMRKVESLESRSIYFANRAMAYNAVNSNDKAIEDCRESLRLNQNYLKARLRLAQYLEQDGHFEEAHQEYQRLADVDSTNQQFQEGLKRTSEQAMPADFPVNMPNMPKGMPKSKEDAAKMFPGLNGIENDPEMQKLMQNPKFQQLAQQIQSNPMAAMGALQDPELAPMVKKLMSKIAPQFAGMFGQK